MMWTCSREWSTEDATPKNAKRNVTDETSQIVAMSVLQYLMHARLQYKVASQNKKRKER